MLISFKLSTILANFKKSGENSFVLLPDYLTNYIIKLFQAGGAVRVPTLSKSGELGWKWGGGSHEEEEIYNKST
mgnify:CR=1 FL=1